MCGEDEGCAVHLKVGGDSLVVWDVVLRGREVWAGKGTCVSQPVTVIRASAAAMHGFWSIARENADDSSISVAHMARYTRPVRVLTQSLQVARLPNHWWAISWQMTSTACAKEHKGTPHSTYVKEHAHEQEPEPMRVPGAKGWRELPERHGAPCSSMQLHACCMQVHAAKWGSTQPC